MLEGIATGLIVAAIVAAVAWLRKSENRERVKQAVCRHDWFDPNEEFNEPGSSLVFISPHEKQCRKCGANR